MKIYFQFIILASILAIALVACQSTPKIYKTSEIICTWDTTEELIICRGLPQ